MNDYDENEYENEEEFEYEREESHAQKVSTRLLTIIQITVCSVVLVTILFLKIWGGNAYSVIRNWYVQNINQTIIPDEQIENVKHRVIELIPPVSNSSSAVSSQAASSSQSAVSSQTPVSSQASAGSQQADGLQSGSVSQQGANLQQAVSSQAASAPLPPVESQKLIG